MRDVAGRYSTATRSRAAGWLLAAGTIGQPLPYGVGTTSAVTFGPNGAIDTTFGIEAGAATAPVAINLGYTFHAFQRQCDGKLVVGGFVSSPSPNLQNDSPPTARSARRAW